MNASRLLAHFDRISDAPDAVPRLRRFILDLAVRGKIATQDANDEPVTELLKRIQRQKAGLLRDGKLRSSRPIEADSTDAEPFATPSHWTWCRLSELGAIIGGGTPPSGDPENFAEPGSGIAWLTPADLGRQKGPYVSRGARDLTPKGLSSSSATVMPAGSVLFSSRAPIGYTAIAVNEVSTNQGFKSIVPYVPECNLYIAVYLRAFAAWIDEKASGTTFREVSGKVVASLPFPLPPLAEQHRIVAKVDELMALCDRLEAAQAERESRRSRLVAASLQRLNEPAPDASDFGEHACFHLRHLPRLTTRTEHVQELRRTILNLAVRGQLVLQDPSDDPVATQLAVSDQARQLVATEDRRAESGLQTLLVADHKWDVPPSWQWRALADLVLFIDYRGQTPNKVEHGVRLITAKNVRRGFINQSPEEFLSDESYHRWMTRGFPNLGDVLFTTEAPMGNAAVVRLTERFALAQRVICFRP